MKEFIKKHKYKVILAIIVFTILIVRMVGWPNILSEVHCDEMMTAVNANAMANTGEDINGISYPVYLLGWGGQSVVLLYLMTIAVKLFGFSMFVIRLPMLIVSLIAIFVFGDFVRRLTKNKVVGAIALIAVAISPWQIAQSIWSLDCNMFPHFLLFSVYLLYRGIEESKKYLLYLSMAFFALCLYCYGIAIYFIPLFLLILVIYLKKNKKVSTKQIILCVSIFMIIALPIITMFVINVLHTVESIKIGNMTIPYYESLARTKDMLFFSDNIGKQFIDNILHTFSTVLGQFDGMEWNASPIFGTIYPVSIIFIIIAMVKIIFKIKRKEKLQLGTVILLTWLGTSIFSGILINYANINRLNSIWYPMLAIAVYGIAIVIQKSKKHKYFVIGLYAVLFISYSIYFGVYFKDKINNSICFSRGYMQALQYADTIEKDSNITYTNIVNDECINIYTRGHLINKNKTYECIREQTKLEEELNTIEKNNIYIVKAKEVENINRENLDVKNFGEYSVVVKK